MASTRAPAPRQCKTHGIILSPNGRCVICRRSLERVNDDPTGSRTAMSALALLVIAVGSALLYRGMTSKSETSVIQVISKPAPAPVPPIIETARLLEEERLVNRGHEAEEQQRAMEVAKHHVQVMVYTTKQCELCRTATKWMQSKKIAFTEIDVEGNAEGLRAMRQRNPDNTVPTIVVEDEVIVGFGPGTVLAAIHRAADKHVRW